MLFFKSFLFPYSAIDSELFGPVVKFLKGIHFLIAALFLIRVAHVTLLFVVFNVVEIITGDSFDLTISFSKYLMSLFGFAYFGLIYMFFPFLCMTQLTLTRNTKKRL